MSEKPEREGPKLSERLRTGYLEDHPVYKLFAEWNKRDFAELRTTAIKAAEGLEDREFAEEWLEDFLYCFDRLPPPSLDSKEGLTAFGAIQALTALLSRLRWEFSSKGGKGKAKWKKDPIVLAVEQENQDQSAAETARRIRAKHIKGLPATNRTIEDWVRGVRRKRRAKALCV